METQNLDSRLRVDMLRGNNRELCQQRRKPEALPAPVGYRPPHPWVCTFVNGLARTRPVSTLRYDCRANESIAHRRVIVLQVVNTIGFSRRRT